MKYNKPYANTDVSTFMETYEHKYLILLDILMGIILFVLGWLFLIFILI